MAAFDAPPQSHAEKPEPSGKQACPPAHAPAPTHCCVEPGVHATFEGEAGAALTCGGGGAEAPGTTVLETSTFGSTF